MAERPVLPITVRPYAPGDAAAMAQLYFESARELGARRYSAEQVAAWAPEPMPVARVEARAGDGRLTLVAVDATGQLLAYGDLESNGHVDHLYAHPAASGTGTAGRILDALLEEARARGIQRLYVEASELARGLFERKGFKVTHRRDFEVHGVALHNYAMTFGDP